MLFRIKMGDREFKITMVSERAAIRWAREKAWQLKDGETITVFHGDTRICGKTRIALHSEADRKRFGLLDED